MWRFLRRIFCYCYFRYIGIVLIGIGAILLIIFVPAAFWVAILGILLILLGILLLRC